MKVIYISSLLLFFWSAITLGDKYENGECTLQVPLSRIKAERIGEGVIIGPEEITVDSEGFIYTATYEGAIWKINPNNLSDISLYTELVPKLVNRADCGDDEHEYWCGRGLGLTIDSHDNLYVANAPAGLLFIPKNDPSNVQVLSTGADGRDLNFVNGVVLSEKRGVTTVYFTDSCFVRTRPANMQVFLANAETSRLLKWDSNTRKTTTVLTGQFLNGISWGKHQNELLLGETANHRIIRLSLTGKQNYTRTLPVYPDNINYDPVHDNYFVGSYALIDDKITELHRDPFVSNLVAAYVPPVLIVPPPTPHLFIFNPHVNPPVTQMLEFDPYEVPSGAKHIGQYIYVTSVVNDFLYRFPESILHQSTKEFYCFTYQK